MNKGSYPSGSDFVTGVGAGFSRAWGWVATKPEPGAVAGEHLSLMQDFCRSSVLKHTLVLGTRRGKICFVFELNQIKDSVNLQLASGKRLPL